MLAESPAVMIVGPRASGKTTTAIRFASTHVRLDSEAEAVAFRADPDAALAAFETTVLLDEWQEVPAVLGAVKRAVDSDPTPGRFLITGSVRGDTDGRSWPLTGRAVRIPMYPLTVRELRGDYTRQTFIDRVVAGDLRAPHETPSLPDYLDLAGGGGFPQPALRLEPAGAARWMAAYLEQLVTRDAQAADAARDPVRLGAYVEALAANTAGVAEHKTIYDAAGITRTTADAYGRLLQNLFVLDVVPAWSTNRLKRLARTPKRHLIDAGLVAAALRVDTTAILRDGDILGRVLETFVAAQLRAEEPVTTAPHRLFHLRQEGGRHEIDVVAELAAGNVIGIEVKATSAPTNRDARHLAWLRDELGPRFIAGVVLHAGPGFFELGDRIIASPISTLWA